ncbi:nitroreductase family protein [Chloroflexota bacterium]
MDVIEAIKSRRSVRRYKSDPVKEEDLQVILEAARRAPSWNNSQCWRFVVVRDPEVRAKLADALSSAFAKNPAIDAVRNAPVVIVACAVLGKSGYLKGESSNIVATDKGDWFMFDVALAMQNLVLAACSLGLGTVHVGLFDAKEAAKVMGLPEGVVCVEMTPLGYPDEEPKVIPRKELSDLVSYDRYG